MAMHRRRGVFYWLSNNVSWLKLSAHLAGADCLGLQCLAISHVSLEVVAVLNILTHKVSICHIQHHTACDARKDAL